MENQLNTIRENKNLYTFLAAKKLYLAHTPEKYILMEKNDEAKMDKRVLSLVSRNTVVISSNGGMLLFPRNRQ